MSGGTVSFLSLHPDGVVVHVHAQPGASRSSVHGRHGEAIKIKVAAPPVDGKANAELVRFLAGVLGVAPREVRIISGETSRTKRVLVTGADPVAVAAALDPPAPPPVPD